MLKRLQTLLVTLSLCVGTVWAGPEDDAAAAADRKDFATVLKIIRPQAIKGEAWAQTRLADAYFKGQAVLSDYAEAVRWYKLAAAQGYANAQIKLGTMYGKGQGVLEDYARAHMWFNLAAVAGNLNAVEGRDIIVRLMTPQQVAEAQKLARECQARNFKNCD